MRFLVRALSLGSLLLPLSMVGKAQQQPTGPAGALSEDSVRVMSGLVQTSVRQLRAVYFEPDDARAAQLIEDALQEIPVYNQRLSRYTASLPREQQQQLARRLRQQPWQVELQTLMRSPQYKGFAARAAKSPVLQPAAERLQASGFVGTARPAPSVAVATPPAAPKAALVREGTIQLPPPARTSPATTGSGHHTVQKGETLYGIARRYHVTPAQLRTWNDKPDANVKIGEDLVVQEGR